MNQFACAWNSESVYLSIMLIIYINFQLHSADTGFFAGLDD
jgi:hypothetical protein